MRHVLIDGDTLGLEEVEAVARGEARVEVSPAARDRVRRSRSLVEARLGDGEAHYGINTGFGTPAEARALVLLRANVLAKGLSGVRPETLDLLVELLNRGVVPVIPERGSVGASGDLAPLAHLALVVIGEGEAFLGGERMPGSAALARAGLSPLVLAAKEGLALVNG